MNDPSSYSDESLSRLPGEREPVPTDPQPGVRSGGVGGAGLRTPGGHRVRYTAERGSGNAGTVYNKLDHEVLDRDAPAGRQVICRATATNARLIAFALNEALPRRC